MGDLYASAIGTTTLQIKEIPPRPQAYNGLLSLDILAEDADESTIRSGLVGSGVVAADEIKSCEVTKRSATVRMATHEAALRIKRAAARLTDLCEGIDTVYNERSYDGRKSAKGREDDTGSGW